MQNVSNINLNILVEKLYIDSAVNKIFKESSEFDWISDVPEKIDLTFDGEHEYWIDISKLSNLEKNSVMDYINKEFANTIASGTLSKFYSNQDLYDGIVLHCGMEENDYIPIQGLVCLMSTSFTEDEDSSNSLYINGKDIIPQVTYNRMDESKEDKDPSVFKDVINDLNLSRSFLFTFGTGIGALMEPVTKLLEGSGIHLNPLQVSMLVITAIAIMLSESNTEDAVNKLKEDGTYQYLNGVKDFITDTQGLMNSILKNVANTTYGLADILGFTFILQPAMKVLSELITDYGVSLESVGQLLMGVGAGAAAYGVKSIVRKLRNKIGKGPIKEYSSNLYNITRVVS